MRFETEALAAARARSHHIRAGLTMMLAQLLLIANDTGVKLLTSQMNEGSIIALRNLVGSLGLFAYIIWQRELSALPAMFGRVAMIRTGLDAMLTIVFFVALAHMPIANLTAIVQSLPIVVAGLAIFTLRERPGIFRLLTLLGGFAGVLLIVQPGSDAFSAYSVLGLAVVMLGAGRDILTRRIGMHVPGGVIAFGNIAGVAVLGLGLALFQGGLELPDAQGLAIAIMSGICVAAGLIVLIKTLRMAPISATAPFRYSVVLWSILSGYFIFGDVPNGLAMAGIGLIIVSGIAAMRAAH